MKKACMVSLGRVHFAAKARNGPASTKVLPLQSEFGTRKHSRGIPIIPGKWGSGSPPIWGIPILPWHRAVSHFPGFVRSSLEDYMHLQESIRESSSSHRQQCAQNVSAFCVLLLPVVQKIKDGRLLSCCPYRQFTSACSSEISVRSETRVAASSS